MLVFSGFEHPAAARAAIAAAGTSRRMFRRMILPGPGLVSRVPLVGLLVGQDDVRLAGTRSEVGAARQRLELLILGVAVHEAEVHAAHVPVGGEAQEVGAGGAGLPVEAAAAEATIVAAGRAGDPFALANGG